MPLKLNAQTLLKLPQFTVKEETKVKLAQLLRDVLKKQAKDGVRVHSAMPNGAVMPKGTDGKRIDLVDTGALWDEAVFLPLQLVFTVPYAKFVIPNYAAGLCPGYLEIYRQKAIPIVKKGLIIKAKQNEQSVT